MVVRMLAGLTLLGLACGSPTSSVNGPGRNDGRTAAEIPKLARLVCLEDGSTQVLTPRVETQSDGLHIEVDNQTGESVSINGIGLDFGPGVSEQVSGAAPGELEVACWPYSDHDSGREPDTLPLRLIDEQGHWVDPEVECPDDGMMESVVIDYSTDADGEQGDPVEVTRRRLEGLETGDSVEIAGYRSAASSAVRVVREGHTVATAYFTPAQDGGWLLGGYTACAGAGIRGL